MLIIYADAPIRLKPKIIRCFRKNASVIYNWFALRSAKRIVFGDTKRRAPKIPAVTAIIRKIISLKGPVMYT